MAITFNWPSFWKGRYEKAHEEIQEYEQETAQWNETVIELEKEVRHLREMNEFLTKQLA